ncbi:MAG: class I adenylate cyclase [Saccharospirillum sp.]
MTDTLHQPALQTPGSQQLQQWRQRFQTVSDGRLSRLRESLQRQQQQCLDLLPLLFHVHLPAMPGYIDEPDVPAGLVDYDPAPATLQLLQSFSRGFRKSQLGRLNPRIIGLYLMGSSGSIGQSITSDFDIWVCHHSDLSPSEIRLLEAKAEALSEWAESFNLEVHFFLMDGHQFQPGDQRSLTGENCGSTQHFLLLDEFYRTGQLLAGGLPLWWLVPTELDPHYQDTVAVYQQHQLIRIETAVDFGPIPALPPGEFIGAGMWQLYKGIDSPHKSVLKLLLLEVYAREFPDVHSLAQQFKEAVHNNFLTLDDLDPYVTLYRRIEHYLLARQEPERLELIRRCFYFKVGISLSRNIRTVTWRRRLMQQLVDQWHWSDAYVRHLDSHKNWPVQDVMRERKLLIDELTRSYRFLTEFAAEHQSAHLMSQQDLLILSRKLHAAFDRRRGKIDFIRFGQDVDLSHEKIRIYERSPKGRDQVFWAAYSQQRDDDQEQALKSTPSLLETLLWCHLNGLLDAHLHIPVYAEKNPVAEFEIRKTLATLRQTLPAELPLVQQRNFFHPSRIERVLMFINLGCDPLQHLTRRGLQKISARSNSLDFSALRENLVARIEMVLVNSWGEVMVERFDDQSALPQALHFLMTRLSKQGSQYRPDIECHCHGQTRPQAIASRVKDLFTDALNAHDQCDEQQSVRFLYNLGDQYNALHFNVRQVQSVSFASEQELIDWLGNEHALPCKTVPDRLFDSDGQTLKAVLTNPIAGQGISVMYQLEGQIATLYLVDEAGSLLRFRQPFFNLATLLAPLLRFLKTTEHRQRSNEDALTLHQRSIFCYELVRERRGRFSLRRQRLAGLMQEGRFINLQAAVDRTANGDYEYQMTCNDREFSTLELGPQFYPAVASYMLGLRAQGQRYPVYITDLALSEGVVAAYPYGQAQTSHYIRAKLKLEQRINEAMRAL